MRRPAVIRIRARGQALILVLLLAAAGAVSLIGLYNVGQTIEARSRLTHAADAAAYSGALVQARTLNMMAYVNRAHVAHQVAMAHLVTLGTWAQFGDAQFKQRALGNPQAPLIGMLFGLDASLAYAAGGALAGSALAGLSEAFSKHDYAVHQVLASASAAALRGLPDTRQETIKSVLHANFPELDAPRWQRSIKATPFNTGLSMRMLSDGLPGFVARHNATRTSGLRPVVEAAVKRYPFLGSRTATRRNAWPVSPYCPLLRHELRRRGSTWLGPDGRWAALDTLSYHALRSNRWIGCYFREYKMGWGTVQSDRAKAPEGLEYIEDPPQDFSSEDYWRWVSHSTMWNIFSGETNPLANSFAMAGAARWPSRGLPSYYEVALARARQPLRFSLMVSRPAGTLLTTDASSKMAHPLGKFAYRGLGHGDAVTVTSAAETFFARPHARKDGRDELATLFRPYWQARRVAVTASELLHVRRRP